MKVRLDANCVIYLVEKNPVWAPKLLTRLAAVRVAGALTDYQRFFSSPAIEMLPLTAAVCERAAEIRVASGLRIKLPDALHLASALEHGCGLFLTNDVALAGCPAIAVEVVS